MQNELELFINGSILAITREMYSSDGVFDHLYAHIPTSITNKMVFTLVYNIIRCSFLYFIQSLSIFPHG